MDLVLVGSDCYIKAHWFLCSMSERNQSFKVVCEYICSVCDQKVRGSKHLSKSQSSPSC